MARRCLGDAGIGGDFFGWKTHGATGDPTGGSAVARFNLAWILEAGNGSIPKNLSN